ncbi:NusA-like transcription termination signal-binding factor [Candidatus Woesearchaeota archaeon]|nr:MAG: NusA-like transcription termination signal-binding factor [Candidatus Woesearchaeota archaeon]
MRLDEETLQTIALFEKLVKCRAKDAFFDPIQDRMVFVVFPGEIYKAIGKDGAGAKKLENTFKKKIKIVEWSDKKERFIRNMCYPHNVSKVEQLEEDVFVVHGETEQDRGLLIGRKAQNLRNLEKNLRRYFPVKEVKVV